MEKPINPYLKNQLINTLVSFGVNDEVVTFIVENKGPLKDFVNRTKKQVANEKQNSGKKFNLFKEISLKLTEDYSLLTLLKSENLSPVDGKFFKNIDFFPMQLAWRKGQLIKVCIYRLGDDLEAEEVDSFVKENKGFSPGIEGSGVMLNFFSTYLPTDELIMCPPKSCLAGDLCSQVPAFEQDGKKWLLQFMIIKGYLKGRYLIFFKNL